MKIHLEFFPGKEERTAHVNKGLQEAHVGVIAAIRKLPVEIQKHIMIVDIGTTNDEEFGTKRVIISLEWEVALAERVATTLQECGRFYLDELVDLSTQSEKLFTETVQGMLKKISEGLQHNLHSFIGMAESK